jgi:hypothetical protein
MYGKIYTHEYGILGCTAVQFGQGQMFRRDTSLPSSGSKNKQSKKESSVTGRKITPMRTSNPTERLNYSKAKFFVDMHSEFSFWHHLIFMLCTMQVSDEILNGTMFKR